LDFSRQVSGSTGHPYFFSGTPSDRHIPLASLSLDQLARALACSEIGVKWFLFLKHSQSTFIKQIHIGSKYAKTDLRPLSTILGTHMRATRFFHAFQKAKSGPSKVVFLCYR